MGSKKYLLWLLAAAIIIPTGCRTEDDTIVYKDSRRWVEKTVAVVAPLNDPIMKARLERTAEWMLSSLHNAQLHDTLCIDLKLEWYDEYGNDLKALGEQLADREDLMAVIGPFDSDNVEQLAPYCQHTLKPLILPTATSETVIRRFAITSTGSGQQPFLWSLTETDVSLAEVMLSMYAANIQRDETYAKFSDYSALFTPDDKFGQTFFEWGPFSAAELGIGFKYNEQYSNPETLTHKMKAYYEDIKETFPSLSIPAFVVVENPACLPEVSKIQYQRFGMDIVEQLKGYEAEGEDISVFGESYYHYLVSSISPVYFVLSNLTDERIAAFDIYDRAIIDLFEGFSPYADPMTGFEMSYEARYKTKPTFAECKFYDALLLAAFAANYMEHHQEVENLNDAIIAITTTDNLLSGYAWSETGMELYLSALEQGQLVGFKGASGPVQFDSQCYTAALNTTYVNWVIKNSCVQHTGYYSRAGNAQTGKALASWNWLVENAEEKFDKQYSDATAHITYPTLTEQYAVLVQGSNGWSNYRHEADVLSIYQMLKANGYDDDHIILVSSDDAANAPENTIDKGAVRIDPNGRNLREGAVIDYKNADLTPQDICNILKGVKTDKTPVVLPADAGQNVLLFWSGHGRSQAVNGANEMAWRDLSAGQGMTADMLAETLQSMADAHQFRQMLVCLEPCYSANMGQALEGIPGVLAICSAGPYEQSFADSWSNELGVWMCDRFSRNLIGHATEYPNGTYRDLYLYCAQHTLGSHVGIYNYTHFGNLYATGPKDFFVKRK